MLRTSGTTDGPKVVALTATNLLHSASCLAMGMLLKRSDVACCAMPLFHIGGAVGVWLCTLVSGSAAIMMPSPLDAHAFLDRLDPTTNFQGKGDHSFCPTWYHGTPTMHQALLLTAKARGQERLTNHLRFVRSSAAHLPHSTALQLAETFDTKVISTYGMTESIPICIPAPGDEVVPPSLCSTNDKQGSVGRPAGCTVAILNPSTGVLLNYGEIGEIAVGGPGVIASYVGLPVSQTHTIEGLLKTGDVGYLDRQGRLFLKGRSKEMIKRGGERKFILRSK